VLNPAQQDLEDRLSRFELKTLIDSTKLILESQDQDFILNTLLFMIMGKLLITRALIIIREPDGETYTVARTKGRSHFAHGQQFYLPIQIPTQNESPIRTLTKHKDLFPTMLANEGYRIMVNLRTNNEHLGWLCLGDKPTGIPINQRELDFLESVVVIPSVGIANSRLISDLKVANRSLDEKVQELHTLFDLSKEFSQSVDRDQILRIFKYALMGQMGVRSFFLILERNDSLEIIVQNAIKHTPAADDLTEIFSMDGDIIAINESSKTSNALHRNGIEVVINLKLQDQKVASLCLGRRMGKEAFTSSDTNFLISLGSLVLMSVQKTYLIESRIEKERLEKELGLARTIQEALLPSHLPDTYPVEISPRNVSSQQVGGDYFDVIDLGNRRFILAIADVTGKGIPASLIMANVQAMVHMLAPLDMPLTEKTARINEVIFGNTPSDTFVTFCWGILDCNDMSFQYVNAGHNPPMLFNKGKSGFVELKQGGIILGALPTMMPYDCETIHFEPDDVLVMFTDGITEAMSPDEEEYGEDRLVEVVNGVIDKKASEIVNAIIESIDVFTHSKYSDDVTILTLRVGRTEP